MDDLEQLLPGEKTIQTKDGGAVSVSPFKVKKLRAVLAALSGVEFDLAGGAEQFSNLLNGPKADQVISAIGLSIDKSPEWIEDTLYPHELAIIAATVFEVNTHFFVAGGMKQLTGVMGRIRDITKSLGANSPPDSSAPDTAGAMS